MLIHHTLIRLALFILSALLLALALFVYAQTGAGPALGPTLGPILGPIFGMSLPSSAALPLGLLGLLLLALALYARQTALRHNQNEKNLLHQQLATLKASLPGAYFQCKSDHAMTLTEVSPQLCALTGYTVEEIRDVFKNSYMQMVHEGDRACLGSIAEGAGEHLRTEYRLLCKDGQSLWVRDMRSRIGEAQRGQNGQNGQTLWQGVAADISEFIRLSEARQIEAERAKILIDMSGSMLYDYHPLESKVRTSKGMAELFDIANPPFIFDRPGLDIRCIHPDDIDTYMSMRTRMLSGAASCEGTLRIRDRHGGNRWYHLRMRAVQDGQGRCAHIVGHLSDAYDADHLPYQRQSAQHDALTGLLTDEGIRGRANAYMTHCEPDIIAALCLIEVSNFAHITSQYGGLAAEELLTLLAQNLRGIFRPTDLLARLEEERFAVLVKDMRDKQGLVQKLDRIREACSVEVVTGKGKLKVCVHMGVSFFPMQGRSFEQLHTYAETALINASKESCGFAVYG